MEILELTGLNVSACVARAAQVLRAGGVVLYPTDTLYGLGADALSDAAVDKVIAIKGRDDKKPIHCVVSDVQMAMRYGVFDDKATALAEAFLPGPLTLIVRKRDGLSDGIARAIETIGIRVPDSGFCIEMARDFGSPITTTSANKSGAPSGRRVEDILAQLGENAQYIDLVIDAGELPESLPSTVVDVSGEEPIILREGAISAADIKMALQEW